MKTNKKQTVVSAEEAAFLNKVLAQFKADVDKAKAEFDSKMKMIKSNHVKAGESKSKSKDSAKMKKLESMLK